ncbi:hypothetical protein EII29_04805 [Leptotrichia sp. OH3620_COT-345]|uniref:hypothetical protein n=1 Tax=Leptotrichia sp. OH3620_COT-345 TaxID=2491048 RepID=UPI000F64C26E|nr:hypothetical protein [Leptotrichia sp. OH3620_COT-345]RRD39845.1 hypothetical protein EII29_04805 [Leptotrichia sp. OH3620_COT-345]
MKRKITLLITAFTMLFTNLMFAANQQLLGISVTTSTNMTTNSVLNRVLGGIMGFLPWIQWIVTAGGLLMFAISIFNLYRGQQLDLAELFKNLVIYGIIIGGAWFGPKLISDMSGASDSGQAQSVNIVQTYIIE